MSTQGCTKADIINLNVGGKKFSTSRQTLLCIPDTFFSSLLSGKIPSLTDDTGAIFIDRDPKMFDVILNFLRTKDLRVENIDLGALRHEAEYYGITCLVRKLALCEEVHLGACGDVLFHGFIPAPIASSDTPLAFSPQGSFISIGAEDNEDEVVGASGGGGVCSESVDEAVVQTECSTEVVMIRCQQSWVAVAYRHQVCLYRLKEAVGWQLIWRSPIFPDGVDRVALNGKLASSERLLAIASVRALWLWQIRDFSAPNSPVAQRVGEFPLSVAADDLLFIGGQLVAVSREAGRIGVWHGATGNWQRQVVPAAVTALDVAGSEFLLLGCKNGSIYYIDMQKFPLRMKDNDLLVTELYRDPQADAVTALSVYVTPKTSMSGGNWIEIAYGTSSGCVRVIVQHPETVGQGPQLFQTFTVHRRRVTRVVLSEKHLISVCAELGHVRSWAVTRFRGMISTQPGSTPLASFHVVSLEATGTDPGAYHAGNDPGPHGDKEDTLLFVQKVLPQADTLFVRLAAFGHRVCVVRSVDGAPISAFAVHECEGSNRCGSRPRRYLFTGHETGAVQIWDLTTALERLEAGALAAVPGGLAAAGAGGGGGSGSGAAAGLQTGALSGASVVLAAHMTPGGHLGGPSPRELVQLLDTCNLDLSPSPSMCSVSRRIEHNDSVS